MERPMQLPQRCPVCNNHLMVISRYNEKKNKSFFQIDCEMNHVHLRIFVNKWPPTWRGVDFTNWVFNEQDILCPICGNKFKGWATRTTKKKKPCLYLCCSDMGAHCQMFLNRPDDLKWPSFKAQGDDTTGG